MNITINLLLKDRQLSVLKESSSTCVVSDNNSFCLKLISEDALPLAVFARFLFGNGLKSDVLLDGDGCCTVPLAALQNDYFEVGFYSDGFATTTVNFAVISSVLYKDAIESETPSASQTQQLIALVNQIPIIESISVNENAEVVITYTDKTEKTVGSLKDNYVLLEQDKNDIAHKAAKLVDTQMLSSVGSGVVE